ncbi:hypothetical protein [Microseira wollei]|uniref:RNA polymerase sigma-70 region 4 domain-containing protein n=1 Tax=Microseira wollei NIES-4236 TaxID=2530354 RepID=A0AAV3XEQ2_9CYAN|nr:hypothetical protein [Microseira wollei]GET39966.1 hypothetical protein MiSe_47390 [Microseira wollei NIES-4236]
MNESQKQPNSLARLHLAAYFEESCFWVAHKLALKRAGKSSYSYLFQEYFQMARVIAAKPENILQGYDSSRSNSLKSIKNWSQLKLTTAISEITGEKTYSDAGLLRRQTETSMEQALQQEGISSLNEELLLRAGVNETQLARCLLAWKSFYKVYTPTTPRGRKKLLWPNAEHLNNIADEYNQKAIQHKLTPSMTAQSIDGLLKTCVRALRNSSEIQISELDEFSSIPDRETIFETEAGIEVLENAEIGECLSNAFTALPKEAQIMLRLWHGLGFNQRDVGELFGIERNQIANKIKAWRSSLLRYLIKYLGQSMTAQEINQKSKKMDLWLEDYCRDQFVYFLSNTLNNELNGDVQLVQKCYNKGKFDLKAGANYLKIPETEVSQRLEKLKEHLGYRLTDYVGSQLTAEVDQILYEALSTLNLAKTLAVDLVNQRLAEFMTSVVRAKAEFLDEENQDIAKFVEEWLTKDKAGV